jgi:hypothetical protein
MIKSSKMYPNPDYSDAGQVIWSRDISISGQVENTWMMQPHRIVENIGLGNGVDGYVGGLKILSNLTDTNEDLTTVNWSALQHIAYQDE